jgi:hypothetical protein
MMNSTAKNFDKMLNVLECTVREAKARAESPRG